MYEKILAYLKKKQDEYVSGEELSHSLGISRQAVWKRTQELRDAGYDIVAVPHMGYRLLECPDRLFTFEVSHALGTQVIGRKLFYFETVPSTMDTALHLALDGAPEGAVVIAETQTKGRGRLGRVWSSPKYKGIYISIILRPRILPSQVSLVTLMVAVALCESIQSQTGLCAQIKWPNDLVINGKKIAGILTELKAETDATSFVVIGIGVNVNTESRLLPDTATSLSEHARSRVDRLSLLQEILRAVEKEYAALHKGGSGGFLQRWRQWAGTLGAHVKVHCHKECIEGVAVDIDSDGGLLIRTDAGVMRKVMAGDIVLCH